MLQCVRRDLGLWSLYRNHVTSFSRIFLTESTKKITWKRAVRMKKLFFMCEWVLSLVQLGPSLTIDNVGFNAHNLSFHFFPLPAKIFTNPHEIWMTRTFSQCRASVWEQCRANVLFGPSQKTCLISGLPAVACVRRASPKNSETTQRPWTQLYRNWTRERSSGGSLDLGTGWLRGRFLWLLASKNFHGREGGCRRREDNRSVGFIVLYQRKFCFF